MKRFLIFFYGTAITALAMEPQQQIRPIEAIQPIIVSILTKGNTLSKEDIRQAEKLIKEIRAQSPARGFQFAEKLDSRKSDDAIRTDSLMTPHIHTPVTPPPTRPVSPLAI